MSTSASTRLKRVGIIMAFALGADQVAQSYGSPDDMEQSDFFGLLSLFKPVQAQEYGQNVTRKLDGFEDFIDDDLLKLRFLDGNSDSSGGVTEEKDPDAIPDDVRELTIYPEPFMTKD